jgi:hypothetical protein
MLRERDDRLSTPSHLQPDPLGGPRRPVAAVLKPVAASRR